MKKKMKKVISVAILLIAITAITTHVYADVGSFESYDSGSSWSSSDWDSDSSWSSSDWDSDSSWSSSSYSKDRSSGTNNYSGSLGVLMPIAIIIIIYSFWFLTKNVKGKNSYIPPKNRAYSTNLGENVMRDPEIYQGLVEEKIKAVDELFNEEEFNQKAKTLFVKMQNAWTDRNWEEIRAFETDELFEQHKTQIDGYIRNNTINVMDRICVLYSKLYKFEQTGDKDILDVVIKSRMADYIIDATTKEIVKGDKQTERVKFYKLEFIRKTGVKTKPEDKGISTTNCPNCGAPTKVTSSGQCEYCKSIITNGEFGWVLNNLEPFQY